jgi:hypothetical protein
MRINFANKDFWAGLSLIAMGGVALWIALGYPMGTALRMGAGYFPVVLSGMLIAFGVILLLRATVSSDSIQGAWSPRALIMLPLALTLFGVLLERAGFIPAMFVLIFGSALAGKEFKIVEVLLLSIGLTAACCLVFIWGLGLPYPLLVGF